MNIEDTISGDLYRDEKPAKYTIMNEGQPNEAVACEWCIKYDQEDLVEATHEVCGDEVCSDCYSEAYE